MKIGIFGGTFNPVHIGHRKLLNSFDEAIGFDKIIVIISNIPPHKSNEEVIDGNLRLEMAKIAFKNYKKVEVSDIELKQEGKSFTYNTLNTLKEQFKSDEIHLIIGSDMFLSFDKWFKYEEIFKMAILCTGSRDKTTIDDLNIKAEKFRDSGANIIVIKHKALEISSTEIRNKISNNEPVKDFLEQGVLDYIRQNNLYLRGK